MYKYAGVLALLAYLVTLILGLVNETPLWEVLVGAAFWATICWVGGLVIGAVALKIVDEVPLPSINDEMAEARQERKMREQLLKAQELKEYKTVKKSEQMQQVAEEPTDNNKEVKTGNTKEVKTGNTKEVKTGNTNEVKTGDAPEQAAEAASAGTSEADKSAPEEAGTPPVEPAPA